jgi:hydrogenase/urease accessory protein HupE
LREPLVHFLLGGALIFAVYDLLSPPAGRAVQADRIVLSEDDLRQLAVQWIAQGRPPPNRDEMRALVQERVSEEILSREAVALGLDKGDEIIKRRLAQKMNFLAEDIAALQDPGDAELRSWFAQNSGRFAVPPRASFHHLYFSADRGQGAFDAAAAALTRIAGKPADTSPAAAGADPFMFQDYYAERTPEQVAKEFGPDFAKAAFGLTPGVWQGPIQSGYGWHLVFVDAIEPSRVPAFEEVEPDVKSAWLDQRQSEMKRAAFAVMRERYTVVVPSLEAVDLRSLRPDGIAAKRDSSGALVIQPRCRTGSARIRCPDSPSRKILQGPRASLVRSHSAFAGLCGRHAWRVLDHRPADRDGGSGSMKGIAEPRTARFYALWLPVFVLALSGSPAHAHLITTGLGPVYDGISHFLMSPEDIIPAFALALLAGQCGPKAARGALFMLPAAWFVGGVAGLVAASPALPALTWLSFILTGGLVAANLKLPNAAILALAAVLGLFHGFLNGSALSLGGAGLGSLTGICATLFVLAALLAAAVISFTQPTAQIAYRVLGSWTTATGVLMFGWWLR